MVEIGSNIYNQFRSDGDAEIFEKLVLDLMLNKYSDDKELTDYILALPKDKKRMAVLSVIDGDNVIWANMNSYVNACSDKFEHIKDVIKIMSKFVKDGDVERKKFGEVMTPIKLVNEMLETLSKEVWSNPKLKWLDPANGAGTFPFVVIYKLMKGLSVWQPDIELRYKHIVENMIYTCELQSRNVFLWLCGVDPKDQYTTNTYWGSFLDDSFDYHMKNVWKISKFDIVIGNPPYQDVNEKGESKHGSGKLYPEFIKKSIDILNKNGSLLFINPNTWFSGSDQSSTGKLFHLFKEYNLISLNTECDGISLQKKYFDKVGTGELTYFLLEKSKLYSNTSVNNQIYIDIRKYDFLPNILNSKTISILEKTLFMDNKKIKIVKDSSEYHSSKTTRNDNKLISSSSIDGYFKIVNSVTKKEGVKFLYMPYKNFYQDRTKILISQSASFENMIVDNGEFGFTQNVTAIICDDINEANYIKYFLNLDVYKYLVNITKYGPAISPRMLSRLPFLPKDVDVYEYFKLTKDEISIIKC
jgi:adenine-specific DNA-methyltransferase